MFEWKVEEMALMKEDNYVYEGIRKIKIYSCENSVSREDKIAFVDSMTDGQLSYLLSLIEKFNEDKENLPKKESMFKGPAVKTTSLKAWIKRNDKKYGRPIIDDWNDYGEYNILGCNRNIQTKSKGIYDYYEDLVDEVFHRKLIECELQEKKYFSEHDERSILERRFEEKQNQYRTTFGAEIWTGSGGVQIGDFDKRRKLTIDELKEFLSKYTQLDSLVEKLTAETHIVY